MTDYRSYYSIAVKGGYGWGNFGDDALMVAAHQIACNIFSASDVVYLCNPATYIRRRLLPNAQVLTLKEGDMLEVDVLLFGGGTQFYSFPLTHAGSRTVARRVRAVISRPYLLLLKMFEIWFQRHSKVMPDKWRAMAAIGIGIGPFVEGSIEGKKTKALFARMDYVAVRDIKSYELCQRWGVTKARHYTDLCFWPGFHAPLIGDLACVAGSSIDRIGVIVRDWPHDEKGDSYYHSLLAVANRLAKDGKAVDFILFAGKGDRVWQKRVKSYKGHVVNWEPENSSIGEFIQTLAKYDLFITARYHGAVFATLLCKPSICIGIEQKLEVYADLLAEGGRCWKYPFDADPCLRYISEIEMDYARTTDFVRQIKQGQSLLAEKMVSEFSEFATTRTRLYPNFA